jgi:glycosyltransferase involved in cell wall biosynthesis
MKKTLIVCGAYPRPENNGSAIRTMNFVRFFEEHGTVDLAYTEGTKALEADNKPFGKEYALRKVDYPEHFGGRMRALLKGFPYPVCQYESTSEGSILSAIERNKYHYILVRYVINSSWLFKLESRYVPRVILDFDDLLSGSVYPIFFDATNSFYKRLYRALNRRFLKMYEAKCTEFGASLFCSEADLRTIARLGVRHKSFVVPNAYPHQNFSASDLGDGSLNPNTLLFVGDLRYQPNINGLNWFVHEVYPRFLARYPDARLLVVGRSPDATIRALQQKNLNIEVHADVPDLRPYYRRSRIAVVPVLMGGGSRIKIMEAALANRPVLSTSVGAEGLDLHDGVGLHLFVTPDEFIEKYKQLDDASSYRAMVENAREVVLARYTSGGFNEALARVVAH